MNTNTKNIVAVLMATIIAMAMFAPTAMAQDSTPITIDVGNAPPEVICKCESPNPVDPNPNTGSSPVTVCAVVCDPNGKDDIVKVTATVYNPDGTMKLEQLMQPGSSCPCTPLKPSKGEAPEYCDYTEDPTCELYVGSFELTICQPGGDYRVVVTATDKGGLKDKLQNRLIYNSIIALEVDFTALDFGKVEISVPKCIYGNDIMEPEGIAPPVNPTIHNGGNDPMQVGFHFLGFLDDCDNPVTTIDMDVRIPGTGLPPCEGVILPICEEVWFDHVFGPCCGTAPVDFSLHVKKGTPAGSLTGGLVILARHAPKKVLLENKDASDEYLYEPINDDKKGYLTYDMYPSSEECKFTFEGEGLNTGTPYCLIYYTDPWPGDNGMLLGTDTAENGKVEITGKMPCGLPIGVDYDYDLAGFKNAKIWLVECSDYTEGEGITDWDPENILFEMETIETCPYGG